MALVYTSSRKSRKSSTPSPGEARDPSPGVGVPTFLPSTPLPTAPTWKDAVDLLISEHPPNQDNLREYSAAISIRLGLAESTVHTYLLSLFKTGKVVAINATGRAAYEKAEEVASLLGIRVAKAFKVLDDCMDADLIHFDKEGNPHTSPDHKTRRLAAVDILTLHGSFRPTKVEHTVDVTDRLAALSNAEIMVRLGELAAHGMELLTKAQQDEQTVEIKGLLSDN